MAYGLKDGGEKFILDVVFAGTAAPSTLKVGLYNDSTDSLPDGATLADITTEPAGSAYSRQSAAVPGDVRVSQSGGTTKVALDPTFTFDLSDSSQETNSVFVTDGTDLLWTAEVGDGAGGTKTFSSSADQADVSGGSLTLD